MLRLFDFLLERAQTAEDFDDAQTAIEVIRASVEGSLSRSPFMYRKSGNSPFLRELLVPFRSAGYAVLHEITDGDLVTVLTVRHQLEDDYH